MRLVIDALELCYAREHIDTFVIASGDSDFVPLASKLRENDKYVIGIGVKMSTSPVFVKACDEFIYLKTEKGEGRRHAREEHPREKKHEKPHPKSDGGKKREIPQIAREVVGNLLGRATGPLNPSFIKEAIVRKEPDFDEREFGFSSFSRLLEAMEKEGILQRIQQGRQWYVVAKDPPEPQGRGRGRAAPVEEEDEEEVYPDPVDDF